MSCLCVQIHQYDISTNLGVAESRWEVRQIFKSLSSVWQIQSPFLEAYLKREAMFSPDDLNILDLLWKHYEKSKNYSAAAKIQAKLADRVW